MRRRLLALSALACVLLAIPPARSSAAATATSVAIVAGAPARLVSIPADVPRGEARVDLAGLRLVDASGGRAGWSLTVAAADRSRLVLDGPRGTARLDGGAAVLVARGGGGTFRPGTRARLRSAARTAAADASIVTLTLAIGP